MTMTDGSQAFANNLARILSEVTADAYEALEVKPARVIHVAPGAQVAWDDCCDGQLWARLVTIEPNRSQNPSGRGVGGAGVCGITHYSATIELGLIRCASVVDDNGIAPEPTTIEDEGIAGIGDMTALLQAAACHPATLTMGRYTPQGPQGGCVGGAWAFSIRLDNCIQCPEDDDG